VVGLAGVDGIVRLLRAVEFASRSVALLVLIAKGSQLLLSKRSCELPGLTAITDQKIAVVDKTAPPIYCVT
jgi:hypothetical protein